MLSKIFSTNKGRHTWSRQTICEIHRMIYDLCVLNLQDRPELLMKIIPLLEQGYVAGIKMTKKLVDYKMSLPEWEKHVSKEDADRIRKLRVELENEISNNL